jgi:hypothetical protein
VAQPDRPPGPETASGPVLTPPGHPPRATSPPQQQGSTAASLSLGTGSGRACVAPGCGSCGRLGDHLAALGTALALWSARDDTRPQPEVRQAASAAIDAADAMLAELHQLRSRLASEVRESDQLAGTRVDALLARKDPDARDGPAAQPARRLHATPSPSHQPGGHRRQRTARCPQWRGAPVTNFGALAILALPKMPERQLRFLLALETVTARGSWREAQTELLARQAGLSVRTAIKARAELAKAGMIEYRPGTGPGHPGRYRLPAIVGEPPRATNARSCTGQPVQTGPPKPCKTGSRKPTPPTL